jgi:hypothetical protein
MILAGLTVLGAGVGSAPARCKWTSHSGIGSRSVSVNARLEFPVALVDTDMVPVVYETFDKLVQDIEPQDVDNYRVVDATGEVFRVRIERKAAPSFWDRLASFLGAPARYEFERSSDALPPDVVEDAKKALTRGPARE